MTPTTALSSGELRPVSLAEASIASTTPSSSSRLLPLAKAGDGDAVRSGGEPDLWPSEVHHWMRQETEKTDPGMPELIDVSPCHRSRFRSQSICEEAPKEALKEKPPPIAEKEVERVVRRKTG